MDTTSPKVFEPEFDDNMQPLDYQHFIKEPEDVEITRAGHTVEMNLERKFTVHSGGYEYGYSGSGPAELALNILGNFLPPQEAWRLHQRFKETYISKMNERLSQHELPGDLIRGWIEGIWHREAEEK